MSGNLKMKNKNKLVFGVGVNDANYAVYEYAIVSGKNRRVWACPFYIKWKDMLQRCYSERSSVNTPTYLKCTVTESWLTFSNFKAWMETQDWESKELDKDLLVRGNTVYGPETCIFITAHVNTFITESYFARGPYPLGVSFKKSNGKFQSLGKDFVTGKRKHLGLFKTAEEAHLEWLYFKQSQAYVLASMQSDKRVAEALIDRYKNYSQYQDK